MTFAKQRLVALARGARILPLLERAKFLTAVIASSHENRAFLDAHPNFKPPPLWWMHDMYSHVSYTLYMRTGAETAAAIAARIDKHVHVSAPRVADWGCGLARVIRHLPDRYALTGFDYNQAAIDWCRENIARVDFRRNGLLPPLPAEPSSFDALYALSVFTHLSEAAHDAWIVEIERVLAPGGVFLGAFHGAPRQGQLLPAEKTRFDGDELVVRGGVAEGGRTFTAFHADGYVRGKHLRKFHILEGPTPFFGQSLYVARRQ
jgi:SAM-dependent methyltransferase